MIRSTLLALAGMLALAAPQAARGELPVGSRAPNFSTQGALAGRDFAFNLRTALARGPAVLYFYPRAFTQGCTLEANAFAEAMPRFRAAGATVVGLSADNLETLRRFSREECRDAFPVAIASPATIRAYDVPLRVAGVNTGVSNRTSYVIARDGRIRMVHSDMSWRDHVRLTLAAVEELRPPAR
ncbi:MAG: peroxiredoxin [Pelagerythrobacter marensis]|nr:MAG: peroxiredoxin [Pelagerythrobacter marensis]